LKIYGVRVAIFFKTDVSYRPTFYLVCLEFMLYIYVYIFSFDQSAKL